MRPGRKSFAGNALAAAALLAALVVFYWPALRGGFLWDDDTYISANPTLLTVGGLRAIWLDPSATCQYYPLSFTVFWIVNHFGGLNPLWFHLLTLLLHGIAALLFWQLLTRLRVRGALLAAAIFAFHPVNVMSVAWMTELKNTLSLALALGSVLAYVKFAALGVYEQAPPPRKPWGWYALSLGLFQVAMLAKTAVSFLPVTLLLILWWRRERMSRRDVVSLIPMLAISVGMGALTIYVERHTGNATGRDFEIGFLDRVLISGRSFWFYLGKLVLPWRLTFIYPRWKLDAGAWWQWLYPVATLVALIGSWLARKRVGKGLFVALTHFYVSTSMLILAVVLYMMRYSFVADHWQYYGTLSICALMAAGITRGLDRFGPLARQLEMGVGIGIALALGTLTWMQCGMYSGLDALWKTTLERNPDCWMACNNLGSRLLDQGQTDDAVALFRRSLEIDPDQTEGHNDLGNALLKTGNLDEALAEVREALRIDPRNAEAHNNLATIFFRRGRLDDAIAECRAALGINPAIVTTRDNLGLMLVRAGRLEEAAEEFAAALQIDPSDAGAHSGVGLALFHEGHAAEAIIQYRVALELDPASGETHKDLGIALFQQGDAAGAIAETEKAVETSPADVQAVSNLAWMLSSAPEPALRDGARAVQLALQASEAAGGGNAFSLRILAAAYAQAGRFPEAVQTAQRALQIAQEQSNGQLEAALAREVKLYEAGQAFEAGPP